MHPRLKILLVFFALATILHILLDDGAFFSSISNLNLDYHATIDEITDGTSSTFNESFIGSLPLNGSSSLCPSTPPGLVGKIRVWMDGPSYDQLEKLYSQVEEGGRWRPSQCLSRHKVAVVVPYRDRDAQLRIMLHNLHALLAKQQLDYGIYIVEQIANQTFNRAKLMNVGFEEAIKPGDSNAVKRLKAAIAKGRKDEKEEEYGGDEYEEEEEKTIKKGKNGGKKEEEEKEERTEEEEEEKEGEKERKERKGEEEKNKGDTVAEEKKKVEVTTEASFKFVTPSQAPIPDESNATMITIFVLIILCICVAGITWKFQLHRKLMRSNYDTVAGG